MTLRTFSILFLCLLLAGCSSSGTWGWYVILPQAIKRILPPLANQFIYIVKMSAFASVIGMQELTRRANELVVTEYRPLEIYTLLILEYLVLVLIISFGVRRLERKMGADESK